MRTRASDLQSLARDDWHLVHCVYLDRELPGTIAHNPRSNMNNSVGYARPASSPNKIVSGHRRHRCRHAGRSATRLRTCLREDDVLASPDTVWQWLDNGYALFPEARADRVDVELSACRQCMARCVHARAFARCTSRPTSGEVLLRDGQPTRVDIDEVRAKAAEQAAATVRDALLTWPAHEDTDGRLPARRASDSRGHGDRAVRGGEGLPRRVAGRESSGARGDGADGCLRERDRPHQGRLRRCRLLEPQSGAAGGDLQHARRSCARPSDPWDRCMVGPARTRRWASIVPAR